MPTKLAANWRFEQLEAAGAGASGGIWKAVDRETARAVALKVGHRVEERARLADEAERWALVDSPWLPRIVDAGRVPLGTSLAAGHPYIALDWAEGEALDPVELARSFREQTALRVAHDVASALADLHEASIAHGDVKPANVIVSSDFGRAALIDLGMAAASAQPEPRGGTKRYLAPEVFEPASSGDGRTRDLWALGVLIAEVADEKIARAADPARVALDAVPARVRRIVEALLAMAPGARPDARWVQRMARAALGEDTDPGAVQERWGAQVRRTYLATRRRELLPIARGAQARVEITGQAGRWLSETVEQLERIAALRGCVPDGPRQGLVDLAPLGRARWLTALVGATAAHWPEVDVGSDSELADRLLALAERQNPRTWSFVDVASREPASAPPVSDDAISLALALSRSPPDAETLDAAESYAFSGRAPTAFVVELGRVFRLQGQVGRALAVLGTSETTEARLESAEARRRAGDIEGARRILDAVDAATLDERDRARHAASSGRVLLDAGHRDEAAEVLRAAPRSAAVHEVRALAALLGFDHDEADREVARGLALASTEEERCRLFAVAGNIAHAAGNAVRALAHFRAAAEHAVRAGAVLEEATYLTGVAATAFDTGELAVALDAAGRAVLLFEHLHRPADAGRAMLTRAAAFAVAGSVVETREAAEAGIDWARRSGDARCRAFCHLAIADSMADDDPEALEHAVRAAGLLGQAAAGDRLFALARVLAKGGAVDVAESDRLSRVAGVPCGARLDWWGARARRALDSPARADQIFGELAALATEPAPMAARAEALAHGARLAAQVGDGDAARRLAQASAEATRKLEMGAPPELRAALASRPWVHLAQVPAPGGVVPEQVADVEALVHALGSRTRLAPLLNQVLDALVLWTGVERGLLLLRGPRGLVPRAARNLTREDLSGRQLELSRSLAERALDRLEPVVAVDAAGELPEVHASVHELKLRSVLAVPLVARGEALGVVYLDDRVRRGAFGSRELSWVRLVAALAAVAIADARDQVLLRRAARRAERAERRLAELLARREAELDVAHRELAKARPGRDTRFAYSSIIGESKALQAMLELVDRVTASDIPLLITGESGSGKELVARAVHENGRRAKRLFVSENCAAIPEGLLESTLFGHVRGAFTGAERPRSGLFEVANGGTLFLDEVGEMSLGMQTKLLRVLEGGEIRPVGGERPRKVDVRVIAATHRDLAAMVEAGDFRRDLYYRLNVINVRVPPLRERPDDIPLLVRHFIDVHSQKRSIRVSRAAIGALTAFSWPGNVRQLENEIRRAIVLADDSISVEHLSEEVLDRTGGEAARKDGLNIRQRVDALESELVKTALERTSGNQTRAAELLGLSRFGLQKMMKRLDISVARFAAESLVEGP